MISYYKVLGVSENATEQEIKTAYRKLQMQIHPDRTGGDDTLAQLVNEAYATLKDDDKRAAYDRKQKNAPQDNAPDMTFADVVNNFGNRMNGMPEQAERFANYPVADDEKYHPSDMFDLSWSKIRQAHADTYENNLKMPFGMKKLFGLAAGFGALISNPADLGVLANIATAMGVGAGTVVFSHYARYVMAVPVTAFEVAGNALGKGLVAQFGKEKTGREQKADVNRTTLIVKFAAIAGTLYGVWSEGYDLSRDAIVKGLLQEDKPAHSLVWRAGEGTVRVGQQVVTGLLPK